MLPLSASVRITTGPDVPEMFFVPMLTMMTLISLPTAAAEQLNPAVRAVQAAPSHDPPSPQTLGTLGSQICPSLAPPLHRNKRLNSSGTSVRVKFMARTTASGLSSETGTTMSVAPGSPHASPAVTTVVCALALALRAKTAITLTRTARAGLTLDLTMIAPYDTRYPLPGRATRCRV
jgi:hypothetical protein